MLTSDHLIPPAEYARRIKPMLPKDAFALSPQKLFRIPIYVLLLASCYVGIRFTNSWIAWLGFSLVIGNIIACVGFMAHELTHNAIVGNRFFRYSLEILLWGLNLIPPTVWRRVHNHTHHSCPNTPNDPDRNFVTSENNRATRFYSRLLYPNRESFYGNLIVGLHFIPYIIRNTLAVFYPHSRKPVLVPYKPIYTCGQRFSVLFELGMITLLQTGIFYAVGGDWLRFIFATPLAVSLTSCIVMVYIFTNHSTNSLCESNDPLASSTSVVVPHVFDKLHQNFSFHTEHHLFPGMGSEHYPLVSELLKKEFPERYHRRAIGEVWHELWRNPMFADQVADSKNEEVQ